ncbi:MAG: DNA-binding protein, partial [Hydrogenophaga sp.]|nr:DNA-binding protein [Hydrogenophaga sp.]
MQMKSTRASRGVQVEEVWAAADAVLAQGERPTIERVRTHLGRGSPNTVAPMLDAWYASLGKRLHTENGEDGAGEQGALPGPVLRAAKALWGR